MSSPSFAIKATLKNLPQHGLRPCKTKFSREIMSPMIVPAYLSTATRAKSAKETPSASNGHTKAMRPPSNKRMSDIGRLSTISSRQTRSPQRSDFPISNILNMSGAHVSSTRSPRKRRRIQTLYLATRRGTYHPQRLKVAMSAIDKAISKPAFKSYRWIKVTGPGWETARIQACLSSVISMP